MLNAELSTLLADLPDEVPKHLRGDENGALKIVPEDPSQIAWSPLLVIELAMLHQPTPESIKRICVEQGVSEELWDEYRVNPVFARELHAMREALKDDGFAFKLRAQLQCGALLHESWKLIHDFTGEVPPSVKADLIKFTIRAAGFDASQDKAAQAAAAGAPRFSINLVL